MHIGSICVSCGYIEEFERMIEDGHSNESALHIIFASVIESVSTQAYRDGYKDGFDDATLVGYECKCEKCTKR